MNLTDKQNKLFEQVLTERGYKKYTPSRASLSHVCTNEKWHWYQTLQRERVEDNYGEMKTIFSVILYIAVWDYTDLIRSGQVHPMRKPYGTQIVVRILDKDVYSDFEFPFFWSDRDLKATKRQMNEAIDTLETLASQCTDFYKSKCSELIV